MTRIAYLDCFSGLSGDMVLGALIDVGWTPEQLQKVIAALRLTDVRAEVNHLIKQGIYATQVTISSSSQQPQRGYSELASIVLQAELPPAVQEQALLTLKLLAEVESVVHNVPLEQVHFHEVGAVDTIVDIVGALMGFHELNVGTVYSAPLPWSQGTIKTAHGILPVPPPAVALLLRDIPITGVNIQGEMVTPTGAALIRSLAKGFGPIPNMRLERVGYGAGQREWPDRPNLLRLVLGISESTSLTTESLMVLACNIDDMNPQWYGPLVQSLLDANALDVWLTPVQMKKNRPATVVEVLCRELHSDSLRDLLLQHTTTLGVRQYTVTRYSLDRHSETVQTIYGPVRIKVANLPDGSQKAAPEHDDCVLCAHEYGVSVREVWLATMQKFNQSTL
ncbi:MAG: nickel pincer cofactor biosynthesis protein LarC [Aggregatilineales bacterium]